MKRSLLLTVFLFSLSQAALADHRDVFIERQRSNQSQEQKTISQAPAVRQEEVRTPSQSVTCDSSSKDQECCPDQANLTEEQKKFQETYC